MAHEARRADGLTVIPMVALALGLLSSAQAATDPTLNRTRPAGDDQGFSFAVATPEQVGMDRAKLEQARQYAQTGGGSGCIIRGGRLVMAWGDPKQKYDIYSSTKSIGVTTLGLALMDGKVQLHDNAKKHLSPVGTPPESNARSGWLDELTLWHLATQTGGFEKTRGWCRQVHRPGTAWIYSDGGPNWLADCLTVAYGRDLLELMNERVFEPLGITVGDTPRGGTHDLHWGFNNLERPHQIGSINRRPFGAGIHCNVEAMAKIGYLYLRRGRWQDRQILSEDFVDLVRRSDPCVSDLPVGSDEEGSQPGSSKHYGLLWWNNADGAIEGVPRDAYWSWGLKESFIIVVPSLDIVAVRAGDYWAPRDDPKRADAHNTIVKPFLLPICTSVACRGPYPQSACIPHVTFSDLILDRDIRGPECASGDQWAGTWADDGHLYMGWGDGTGFGHRGDWQDSATAFMGFARIEGTPPHHRGINRATAVFEDPQGVNAHVSSTYNKALDRYLQLTTHSHGGTKKGFGVFESDRPWGPWSTVYYTDKLDDFVSGLTELISASLPSKWISPEGRSMWLVFAGRPSDPFYSFNLIRVNLDVSR